VFAPSGLRLIANSSDGGLASEASLHSNEFEIYTITQRKPVEFAVDLKVLHKVLKSALRFKTYLKYPVGDNKLAVM
jgi:hypothetical protein